MYKIFLTELKPKMNKSLNTILRAFI